MLVSNLVPTYKHLAVLKTLMLVSVLPLQRTSLERVSYALRPIRTPGLLFPSLLNAPLPRIKPQPLHMTMVMTHRQQARDRRILQLKSWQEMRMHLRNERHFDRSLGVFQEDQACELAFRSQFNIIVT